MRACGLKKSDASDISSLVSILNFVSVRINRTKFRTFFHLSNGNKVVLENDGIFVCDYRYGRNRHVFMDGSKQDYKYSVICR